MPRRTQIAPPNFKYPIWKKDGKTWTANPIALAELVSNCGWSEEQIRSRMRLSYHYLVEALDGKSLDRWGVAQVEYGVSPMTERQRDLFGIE